MKLQGSIVALITPFHADGTVNFERLGEILDTVRQLEQYIKIRPVYLITLLKMTGITYSAEFASGICKDAGYASLGKQIEIFGKLTILAVSMPVLLALFGTLDQILT